MTAAAAVPYFHITQTDRRKQERKNMQYCRGFGVKRKRIIATVVEEESNLSPSLSPLVAVYF